MTKTSVLCLLALNQAFAFTLISFDGKPTRWGQPNISYVVDSRGSQDFKDGCDSAGSCESERVAIQKAFQSWTTTPGVNLSFQEQAPQVFNSTGYDGKNTIIFIHQNWGNLNFSPPSGALAVTITTYRLSDAKIVDADIHFNGQYFNWGVIDTQEEKNSGNIVDLQNVAAHEVGHFLGLGHSSENYTETNFDLYMATMFFASGPGETFRRVLKTDDVEAIRHLYPQDYVEKPAIDSVSPEEIDVRSSSNAIVDIAGSGFTENSAVILARKSDRGDVIGRILSRTDTSIQVELDTYGLGSGSYDIVVANSPDAQDRMLSAISLTSNWSGGDVGEQSLASSESAGGCSAHRSGSGQFLLMIALPFIFVFPGQLRGVTLRIRRHAFHSKKIRFP